MRNAINSIVWVILLVLSGSTRAESPREITWWAISGGGMSSTGGDYILTGAIGQPLGESVNGGVYTLVVGFWDRIVGGVPVALCGDVNMDTQVNTVDVVQVLRRAVGLVRFTPQQERNADTNNDGSIDVVDAIKILRITVQLDPPCSF